MIKSQPPEAVEKKALAALARRLGKEPEEPTFYLKRDGSWFLEDNLGKSITFTFRPECMGYTLRVLDHTGWLMR